jgi:glycerophosphoryl diester phosphodiesterase
MKITLSTLFLLLTMQHMAQKTFERQGHRGARGLAPENTIAGMQKAIDAGIDVLELDVVISKDRQVVVSHDHYMSSVFCLKPNGAAITPAEEKSILLYQMRYSDIKKYDVGTKAHPQFPQQVHLKTYKPLLAELVDSSDAYARRNGKQLPKYNIEIKSNAAGDGRLHPAPPEFVELVLQVCRDKNILQRMNIQSFDVRPLQVIHQKDSSITLSYLVMNLRSLEHNLKQLGFTPDIYSPHYKILSKRLVDKCHRLGMRVIPWTVNTVGDIRNVAALGVDGIISDYPNYFDDPKEW